MLKSYLKQICNLEEEVRERTLKLDKANTEFDKAKLKIAEEKEKLKKELDIKKSEFGELSKTRSSMAKYKPEGILSTVFIFLIAIVVTVAFAFAIRALVMKAFGATDAESAATAYMVINILPIVLCWLLACLFDCFSWGKTAAFAGIYAIINFLTWWYFSAFENKGHTISYAMMIFMGILIAIEVVIGVISCFVVNYKQKNRYREYQWYVKSTKQDVSKLMSDIEVASEKLTEYTTKSKQAITFMSQDISNQQNMLEKAKTALKSLYAQNVLHPNYQNWVAAATIYEYIDVGRCSELKGYTGAYNLYEKELLAKQILGSLNAINSSINRQGERLLSSQNYIRRQLSECNNKLDNYKFNTYGY